MITGERVRLRAVEPTDIDQVMLWINDEAVTRYLSQVGSVTSRAAEQEFLNRVGRGDDRHCHFFTIETAGGEYLGLGNLDEIDPIARHAELAVIIGRAEEQGKGYGTAAVQLLLRVAFDRLNLDKVYLRVVGGNQRAIEVYRRCGFREAVRFREHCYIHGEWQDDVLMEVFRPELRLKMGES